MIAFCLPTDSVGVLPATTTIAPGDVTDIESIRAGMPSAPDAVFHLAANTSTWSKHSARQYHDNVGGTTNLIDVALEKSASRFICTSSVSAYGYHPGLRIDENTPSNAPTRGDNYGRTKLLAERQIRQAATERGLWAVILNPVNILGSYDRNNWSRQLILPISRGSLRFVPPGSATWAYVDDIVAAHLAAADRGRSGQNYILGGVRASFKKVINEIEEILGGPISRRVTPRPLLRLGLLAALARSRVDRNEPALTSPQYRRAVGDLRCDDHKARRELRYSRTELRTMLTETISWLQREHLLDQGRYPQPGLGAGAGEPGDAPQVNL